MHCFAAIALISGFLGGGEMCFFGEHVGNFSKLLILNIDVKVSSIVGEFY